MSQPDDSTNFFAYVNQSLREEEDFHFLRFEFLQRLNLTQFQVRLVRLKSQIQKKKMASPSDLEFLQSTLKDYATAIRDYRYLRNQKPVTTSEMRTRKLLLQRYFHSVNDCGDPFQSHYAFFKDDDSRIDPLREAFMRILPVRLTYSREERRQRGKEFMEGKTPLYVSRFVDRSVRFAIAMTGGLFLIVPMIVMALRPSPVKSLVTVSIALVMFSLLLSFGVRVSNIETLLATSTYAAVLVVFVGTTS